MVTNTNFASFKTNVCPTQNLGPNEKKRKANGCLLALTIPSSNRSSLDSCTFVPHNLGSWQMASLGKYMFIPFGIYRSPIVMSIVTCLFCLRIGEIKQRVSIKIIVNYTPSNHTINNQVDSNTWVEKKLQKDWQKIQSYHFQFVEHVEIKWMIIMSAYFYDFFMNTFLPTCIGCQQHHGPCEKNCCRVMPNQEEGLAFIFHWLHAKIDLSTLDSSFLWHCSEHELQQFISICQEFYYSYKFLY